jgi:Skp family chaperone for outer membrane proteins
LHEEDSTKTNLVKRFLILIIALSSAAVLKAQDTALHPLPSKYLSQLSSRTEDLTQKLDKKSEKAIAQLQKQEEKIRRKLSRLDSSKAKELFNNAEEKYGSLKTKLEKPLLLRGTFLTSIH